MILFIRFLFFTLIYFNTTNNLVFEKQSVRKREKCREMLKKTRNNQETKQTRVIMVNYWSSLSVIMLSVETFPGLFFLNITKISHLVSSPEGEKCTLLGKLVYREFFLF